VRTKPAFALFVVLTLSIGIGANTAAFTAVNTLFLNPLPEVDLRDVIAIETVGTRAAARTPAMLLSMPELRDLQQMRGEFGQVAGYTPTGALTLSGLERPERIFVEYTTGNYFQVLGLKPLLGRFFDETEDREGAQPVAVLGYAAWQKRFGGEPNILGRRLTMNSSVEVTVIGVAPPGFRGVTMLFGPDIWIPAGAAEALLPGPRNAARDRAVPMVRVAARLNAGSSVSQVKPRLAALAAGWRRDHPELNPNQTLDARPMPVAILGDMRTPMFMGSLVLMAVVGLVLLIACSNAASLFLSRATARRQEMAVRLAMGASRGRLVRQLVTESLLFGLLSGAAGVAVGWGGCRLLWSVRPADVANNFVEPRMDDTVLLFALAVSLLTGLLFGLVPALQCSRADVSGALKEEARTAGRSRMRVRFQNVLLAGQVAFSLVALVVAGLFLRSIQEAYRIDPGFQTKRLAVVLPNQGGLGYSQERVGQFYREVRRRLGGLPGVRAVSWSSNLPLWNRASRSVVVEGQEQRRTAGMPPLVVNTTDLDYFAALGIGLTSGREFREGDGPGTLPVAIVNQTMAERYWPNRNPVGLRFQFAGETARREIVGVAKTANYSNLGEPPQPSVYLPAAQNTSPGMMLYIRTEGPPESVLAAAQRELRAIEPRLDVTDARTGDTIMDQVLFTARVGVGLLSVFGLVGLALAAVGLYGVMAYMVGQRKREIGVRVAMGASHGAILKLVVRQGMLLVGVGVAVGLAASVLLTRGLAGMLYVSPGDATSLAGASAVLLGTGFAACYRPARAASRIDPLSALRDS
jgi:predicted permease